MKKGLLILVTLALLGTFAFADMAASVYMTGSLYGTDGFIINNQNQKDSDLLQFSISGETTGASFRLWANTGKDNLSISNNIVYTDTNSNGVYDDGVDTLVSSSSVSGVQDPIVYFRSAVLWWKPIAQLKLSIGNVGGYGFTEQLNWWKVPMGGSIDQANQWDKRYSSASTGEAGGIQLDIDPMAGLTITAGLYPGFGNAFGVVNDTDEEFYDANTAWGLQAKYSITGFGSILAAIRDDGFEDSKLIRVGMDINAVPNLYAFVTAIMLIDDHTAAYAAADADGMMLRGVSIDNYIKYSMDKLTIQARFPVTLRLTGETDDDSYMLWRVKVSYALDGGVTPYLSAETVDFVPLNFAAVADTFSVTIQPGLNWSIDKGSMDLSLKVDVYPEGTGPAGNDMVWSLPWEARISF